MGRPLLLGSGAAVAAIVLFVAIVLVLDGVRAETIADGVRIGTVDVGGMERDEARALVQRELEQTVATSVTATYEDRTFELEAGAAKARLDSEASVDAALQHGRGSNPFSRVLATPAAGGTVAPRVAVSRAAVADFVEELAGRVDRKARDADIEWRNGKLDRTRARNGVQTQRGELVEAILRRMRDPGAKSDVEVPVKVTERPDRNLDDLAKRYPTVIAVDRDGKQLRLYKHLQLEHRYNIAVGKAGHETRAGRYKLVSKQVDPTWHAPDSDWAGELAGQSIPAGDPRNPLEARWMGFHDGQGIHGTSDIDSLGGAASHGCIRMAVRDVEQLYDQVERGTPVFIQ